MNVPSDFFLNSKPYYERTLYGSLFQDKLLFTVCDYIKFFCGENKEKESPAQGGA
jgi:hypothetical protein